MGAGSFMCSPRGARALPLISLLPRFLCLVACLAALLLAVAPAAGQGYELNLVYSLDIRGRMLPVDDSGADCSVSDATTDPLSCFGGTAKRAAFIQEHRANYTNTLALDVGNQYFGTSFPDVASPVASNVARWMSKSPYDVVGIGTNEFFNGPAQANSYMSSFLLGRPEVICSNINVTAEPLMATSTIAPYTVFVLSGRKIGVVGAVDTRLSITSSPGPNVHVNDPVASVTAAVNALFAVHPDCNIVVMVTTVDVSEIRKLIANVPGLDIILYRPSTEDSSLINLSRVPGPTGDVLIATLLSYDGSSLYGGSMSNLRAMFDVNGVLESYTWKQTPLNNIVEDAVIWAEVQLDADKVTARNGEVIGQLTDKYGDINLAGDYPDLWCRAGDCNIGRLFTESMLNWCKDCDIAHVNAGGLRANIYKSPASPNVTRLEVAAALGFSNTFATYQILGKDFLQSVLQFSISKYKKGAFNQFSNIRWAWNPDVSLVASAFVYQRSSDQWLPLDPARVYKCVTINFLIPPTNGGRNLDTEKPIGPLLGLNLFGPPALEGLIDWIRSAAFVPPPTLDKLRTCSSSFNYTLEDDTGTGSVSWPLNHCNILQTTGTINLADRCPTNLAQCAAGGEAYEGKLYDTSRCHSCTGLGTCISGYRRCACDRPTTAGLFSGIDMISGPDCSSIRQEYITPAALKGFTYFVSTCSVIVAICSSIFFFIYRETKVVKRSAHTFLQLACAGSLLGAICSFNIVADVSDATCEISTWFGNMGFVLLFGSLFIKTWRIKKIFGHRRLKMVVLRDSDMMLRLGVFVLMELTLRLVELGVSPVEPTPKQTGDCAGATNTVQDLIDGTSASSGETPTCYFHMTCSSEHFIVIDAVSWAYKGALTLWGCILAYGIKDIPEDFNESRLLALVIYHMTVLATIAKVLVEFLGNDSPSATLVIQVMAINIIICVTLLALSWPKYSIIQKGGGDGLQNMVTKAATNMANMGGHSKHSSGVFSTVAPVLNPQSFIASCAALLDRLRDQGDNADTDVVQFVQIAHKFAEQLQTTSGASIVGAGAAAATSAPPRHTTTAHVSAAGNPSATKAVNATNPNTPQQGASGRLSSYRLLHNPQLSPSEGHIGNAAWSPSGGVPALPALSDANRLVAGKDAAVVATPDVHDSSCSDDLPNVVTATDAQ